MLQKERKSERDRESICTAFSYNIAIYLTFLPPPLPPQNVRMMCRNIWTEKMGVGLSDITLDQCEIDSKQQAIFINPEVDLWKIYKNLQWGSNLGKSGDDALPGSEEGIIQGNVHAALGRTYNSRAPSLPPHLYPVCHLLQKVHNEQVIL